jgi:hypothetical protein
MAMARPRSVTCGMVMATPEPVEGGLQRAADTRLDDEQSGDDRPPALREPQELHHHEGGNNGGHHTKCVAQLGNVLAEEGDGTFESHRFSSRISSFDSYLGEGNSRRTRFLSGRST